jgi:hypothetical protein
VSECLIKNSNFLATCVHLSNDDDHHQDYHDEKADDDDDDRTRFSHFLNSCSLKCKYVCKTTSYSS